MPSNLCMERRVLMTVVCLAAGCCGGLVVDEHDDAWRSANAAMLSQLELHPGQSGWLSGLTGAHRTDAPPTDSTEPDWMFYWELESKSNPATDPLVIFLSGGPGLASLVPLFYDVGPLHLKPAGGNPEARPARHPITGNANVLFIDSPFGTGYSPDGPATIHSSADVAVVVARFLRVFFKVHPRYHGRDIYLMGTSFAGHFIPALAHHLLTATECADDEASKNLRGVILGSPWSAPEIQLGTFGRLVREHQLASPWLAGLLEYFIQPMCLGLLRHLPPSSSLVHHTCFMTSKLVSGYKDLRFSEYDFRKPASYPDFNALEKHASTRNSALRSHLRAHRIDFTMQNDAAMETLMAQDWSVSYIDALRLIKERGLALHIYGAEYDYLCNYFGVEAVAHAISPGLELVGYEPACQAAHAGIHCKSVDNVTLCRVDDAGHFIGMEKPAAPGCLVSQALKRGGQVIASTPLI